MKNLIIFALLLTLVSCGKRHCWECQEEKSYNSMIKPPEYGEKYMVCDATSREIKEHTDSVYQYGTDYSLITTCEKQD